jgi:hypothetical protein
MRLEYERREPAIQSIVGPGWVMQEAEVWCEAGRESPSAHMARIQRSVRTPTARILESTSSNPQIRLLKTLTT